MRRLVLASKSLTRARVLKAAGVVFDVMPAKVDEVATRQDLTAKGMEPRSVAKFLAESKALAVSDTDRDALVIGADQLLVFQGQILSKAENLTQAESTLRSLRNQSHQLISAVSLATNGAALWRYVDVATLQMRAFSDAFLTDYLFREGDDSLTSVGCYRLEGMGVQFFSRVEGDYFSVLGLPLLPLLGALRDQGILPS